MSNTDTVNQIEEILESLAPPKWCIVISDEWDYSQIGISAYNPIGLKRLNIINPTWHCILILEEF